ncbi:MAG: hypothetical protein JWR04_3147 [Rhodoglobus sp.]|nr:hypothetical protein [Rhodoglobus sp.]
MGTLAVASVIGASPHYVADVHIHCHPFGVAQLTDDDRLVQHIFALERWARHIQRTRSVVRESSDAEADITLAGGGWMVPAGIIEGLINSAVDHMLAWHDKCITQDDPPEVRLSAYADYTLLRPAIESLANVVWMVSPDESRERVLRSLKFTNIELQHGKKLVAALAAAGTPDVEMGMLFERAEPRLIAAATAAGLDPDAVLSARRIVDETKILRTIGALVGGPTYETLKHWARASAHAHSQVLTTLLLATRETRSDDHGEYLYAEVDTALLADTCALLLQLMNVAVDFLNRRGYERVGTTQPNSAERPGNA